MPTFLYTWNPDNWNWVDQADAIRRVNDGEPYERYWSCGSKKKQIGDAFLLMRLGVEPKGIIGCGYISSEPFIKPHWDAEKRAAGKRAARTYLLFKALSDRPLISLAELQRRFPSVLWTPQQGGVAVPEQAAADIVGELMRNAAHGFRPQTPDEVRRFAEGRVKTITVSTYDRSSEARAACLSRHGYACAACGFTFESKYAALGAGYIEVHHLRQLADAGGEHEIDPEQDLRPVCANCHRMLHRRRPPLSIEELVKIMKGAAADGARPRGAGR
jgi:5-methylcytosine-specific restriction protein A